MNITDKQIEQLADNAKLELNKAEKNNLKSELNKIITSLEVIKDLDTSGIQPLISVNEIKNVFREDSVQNDNYDKNQELALKNVPNKKDGFVVVPSILE